MLQLSRWSIALNSNKFEQPIDDGDEEWMNEEDLVSNGSSETDSIEGDIIFFMNKNRVIIFRV